MLLLASASVLTLHTCGRTAPFLQQAAAKGTPFSIGDSDAQSCTRVSYLGTDVGATRVGIVSNKQMQGFSSGQEAPASSGPASRCDRKAQSNVDTISYSTQYITYRRQREKTQQGFDLGVGKRPSDQAEGRHPSAASDGRRGASEASSAHCHRRATGKLATLDGDLG